MFNLERAIMEWKKTMRRGRAMQDGDLAELESYLRDKVEDLVHRGMSEEEAFKKAEAEFSEAEGLDADYYRARARNRGGRPPWQEPRFMPALLWNYVKIALRKIRRQKGYAFINIAGLALGFACSIMAILFIRYEQSYDRYHEYAGDIFRVVYVGGPRQGTSWYAHTPGLLKSALAQDFPEIVRACRIKPWDVTIQKDGRAFHEEKFYLADPEFLEMFTCPLTAGDPRTALAGRYALLLTEAAAEKYFGRENPVGRTLGVDGQDFRITGVVKNPPRNTHFHFDFLASFETLYALQSAEQIDNWNQASFHTYIQLRAGAAPAALSSKLPDFVRRRIEERYRYDFRLQPLSDIHLRSAMNGELEANGDIRYVYLLAAIGLIVLLVACLNYMNLATARSARCAREVGLRKVVGADRAHIVRQFLGESAIFAAFAVALSLFLVQLALPLFNSLSGRSLSLRQLSEAAPLGLLAALTAVVGLAAGSYPALYLSSFRPVLILKGVTREDRRRSAGFRRALVVAQFVISIVLVSCTLIVHHQLRFIRDKKLGFVKDLIVTVPVSDDGVSRNPETLRAGLLRDPRVSAVAFSSDLPSAIRSSSFVPMGDPAAGKALSLYTIDVDPDFLDLYGLKLLAGRNFSRRVPGDAQGATILNEAARRALGPADPLGNPLAVHNYPPGPVLGIVEDFHFAPLTQPIEPLAIQIFPRYEGRYFSLQYASVKLGGGDVAGTLAFIEKTFRTIAPGSPFSYAFLDDQIGAMYRAEQKLARTFDYFTLLAVLVACLGLLGLASFMAERRTREIGVRRVLGASTAGIAVLLNREFLQWVAASAAIACPAAFFVMRLWLRKFAYRAPVTPWIFAQATLLALAAALLVTGWQTFRAARANPITSLKHE